MNRYLLFGYDAYYPSGGWNDFISSWKSLEAAQNALREEIANNKYPKSDYYDIVDLEKNEIVYEHTTEHKYII